MIEQFFRAACKDPLEETGLGTSTFVFGRNAIFMNRGNHEMLEAV